MNRIYRLVWSSTRAMFVPTTELSRSKRKGNRDPHRAHADDDSNPLPSLHLPLLLGSLLVAHAASAATFVDLSNGLTGWSTAGIDSVTSNNINAGTVVLTPATGYSIAVITAQGGPNNADAALGLSANSLHNFLSGSTNFGYITNTYAFNPGSYSFAWAYRNTDLGFDDGALFSLVGGGSQSLISLARNVTSPASGTLVLSSGGTTAWLTTNFTITTAGNYQVGFVAYNGGDTSVSPNFYVSSVAGFCTGSPVLSSCVAPPVTIIGSTGGNVSASVFDTTSAAYAQTTLTFAGGTLRYTADTVTAKNAVLNSGGGGIDTNGTTSSITGTISGVGGLTKLGSGTLTLNQVETYTGATTISAGTLALTGNGSIASSSGLVNNAVFDISGTTAGSSIKTLSGTGSVVLGAQTLTVTNAAGTFSGTIDGSGGLTVSGGTMSLSGVNGYTGATQISSGTLALNGSGSIAASSAVINNAAFDISGTTAGASVATLSGTGTVALGAQNLTVSNGSTTFDGVIDGSGGLTLNSGTFTLSNTNTYTGATQISAGTLALTGNGSIAASSSLVNNAVFDISGATAGASIKTLTGSGNVALGAQTLTVTNAAGTFAGAINGSGALTVSGGTMNLSGTNGYTGATQITSGTLSLTGGGSIAASSGVINNAAFDISGTTAGASIATLSGTGTVALGSKDLTFSNASTTFGGVISGSGGLTLNSGTFTLGNANLYTGTTHITAGTLVLTGNGSVAASNEIANDGILDISGSGANATITTLSGAGSVVLGSRNLAITNGSTTFAGGIGGTGGFTLSGGTLSLSGANSYTGVTQISSGVLVLAGDGSIAASSEVANDAVLDISASNAGATITTLSGTGNVELGNKTLTIANGATTFAGTINGGGALQLNGGELTLSNSNAYTGVTQIASGTLKLADAGSIAASNALVDNGVFDITAATGDISIKTISGTGAVELGTHSLILTAATGHFAGTIAGDGSITIANGASALDGVNTYTGGTTIQNGATLSVASDTALGDAAGALHLGGGTLSTTASFALNRTVAIDASSTLDTNTGTTLTSATNLSGPGALIKSGTGTLILSGDNSQWGAANTAGLIVNDGSVVVGNSDALGKGVVAFNAGLLQTVSTVTLGNNIQLGSGNVSFNIASNTVATLTGTVNTSGSGTTCFAKNGTGTLVLTGAATVGNGTCVQQGSLYANGTLNSAVNVAANATLRGTGTISGPLNIHGTLAPGNSPGVLSVNASVVMAPGSTYQEDINGTNTGSGPGSYSRLLISGAGNQFVASGATLSLNLANITGTATYVPYVPRIGDMFRIVTAEGGIVGQFAALTPPAGLSPTTRVDVYYNVDNSNSIDLFIVPVSYEAYVVAHHGNRNARSMAQALDLLVQQQITNQATAEQTALLYDINTQTSTALDVVATQLSGEIHGAMLAAAPLADRWLVDSVARQLTDASSEGRGVWIDVGAQRGDWHSDATASGFDTSRSQVAVGWDLIGAQHRRAGVGFMHGDTDVDAHANSGSITQNTAFAYAQYSLGATTFEGTAAFGMNSWETHRSMPFSTTGNLTTDIDGHTALISAGVRYAFALQRFAFETYGRATWQQLSRESFDEGTTSLASLSAPRYQANGVRFTAGLTAGSWERNPLATRFTYTFNLGIGIDDAALVRPSMRAAIVGTTTVIRTPDVDRAFLEGQLAGTVRLSEHIYGQLGVSGEARDGMSSGLGANLGVRVIF